MPGAERGRSRRLSYGLIGACLAQGAAAGLLLVRLIARGQFSLGWTTRELAGDPITYLYVAVSTTLVFSLFGALLGRRADQLARLATTDPLTGLLNARAFRDRFHQEAARAARYRQPLSLLLIDLDGLKGINDRYGHESGDEALRRVAAAIRHGLREADLGARVGGDEFTVLAPNTNDAAALSLGERLRALVIEGSGSAMPRATSVSSGIATLVPAGRQTSDEVSLMRGADEALYRAKHEGGNRVARA